MALDREMVVGVVGAGAMGTGIAQVAATAGHRVVLADANPGAAARARINVGKTMAREILKGRKSREAADDLMGRIDARPEPLGDDLSEFASCRLVIEAIVEDLAAKQTLFKKLE